MKFKIYRDGEYLKTEVSLTPFSYFGFNDEDEDEESYESTEIIFAETEDSRKPKSIQIDALKFLIENADTVLQNVYQYIFDGREALEEVFRSFDAELNEGFPLLNTPEEVVKYVNFATVHVYPSASSDYYFGLLGNSSWESEHGVGVVLQNLKVIDFGDSDTVDFFDMDDDSEKSIQETYSLADLSLRKKRLNGISQFITEAEAAPCLDLFQFLIDKRAIYGYRYSEVDLSDLEKAAYIKSLRLLDLSKMGLEEIPPSIEQCVNLKHLNLRLNKLTILPDSISRLSSLESLNLNWNEITHLPASLTDLINLDEIDLSRNKLNAFPPELRDLKKLKSIQVSYNRIKSIPPWIDEFPLLSDLHFSENELLELPESIGNIPTLEYLNVSDNKFTEEEVERIEKWLEDKFVLEIRYF